MGKRKKNKGATKQQPKNTWEDQGFGGNPFSQFASNAPAAEQETPKAQKAPEHAKPRRATVRIQRKGRGGKTVTILSHLGVSKPETLEHWCDHLRKKLGCGGTVEEEEIVLQGDQRQRIEAALRDIGVERITGL